MTSTSGSPASSEVLLLGYCSAYRREEEKRSHFLQIKSGSFLVLASGCTRIPDTSATGSIITIKAINPRVQLTPMISESPTYRLHEAPPGDPPSPEGRGRSPRLCLQLHTAYLSLHPTDPKDPLSMEDSHFQTRFSGGMHSSFTEKSNLAPVTPARRERRRAPEKLFYLL